MSALLAACMRASTVGLAMVKTRWLLLAAGSQAAGDCICQSAGLMTLPMLSGLAGGWCLGAPRRTKHDRKLWGHCRLCAAQCRAALSEPPARTCVGAGLLLPAGLKKVIKHPPQLLYEVGPHAGKAVLQSAIVMVVKPVVKDNRHVASTILLSHGRSRFQACMTRSLHPFWSVGLS